MLEGGVERTGTVAEWRDVLYLSSILCTYAVSLFPSQSSAHQTQATGEQTWYVQVINAPV